MLKILGRKFRHGKKIFKDFFDNLHEGKQCQLNIDECGSSPCQNKGICLDKIDAYQCRCQTGYNGTNCENKIDWCAVNQCSENSNCSSGLSTYTCDCFQGRQVLTLVTCFHFWLRTTQIKYWFSRLKSFWQMADRKSTRLNSSHVKRSRMPSSAWKKKHTIQQHQNKVWNK